LPLDPRSPGTTVRQYLAMSTGSPTLHPSYLAHTSQATTVCGDGHFKTYSSVPIPVYSSTCLHLCVTCTICVCLFSLMEQTVSWECDSRRSLLGSAHYCLVVVDLTFHKCVLQRYSNCAAPPLPGGFAVGRARVDCMKDIFILNEIWEPGKIYILIGTLLDWNILLIS
jgi:hypothetical protein